MSLCGLCKFSPNLATYAIIWRNYEPWWCDLESLMIFMLLLVCFCDSGLGFSAIFAVHCSLHEFYAHYSSLLFVYLLQGWMLSQPFAIINLLIWGFENYYCLEAVYLIFLLPCATRQSLKSTLGLLLIRAFHPTIFGHFFIENLKGLSHGLSDAIYNLWVICSNPKDYPSLPVPPVRSSPFHFQRAVGWIQLVTHSQCFQACWNSARNWKCPRMAMCGQWSLLPSAFYWGLAWVRLKDAHP